MDLTSLIADPKVAGSAGVAGAVGFYAIAKFVMARYADAETFRLGLLKTPEYRDDQEARSKATIERCEEKFVDHETFDRFRRIISQEFAAKTGRVLPDTRAFRREDIA